MEMNINGNSVKSYMTEVNLFKALVALGISEDRHLVVRNEAGRYTAIFPMSNIKDGDICRYARHGFFTLG